MPWVITCVIITNLARPGLLLTPLVYKALAPSLFSTAGGRRVHRMMLGKIGLKARDFGGSRLGQGKGGSCAFLGQLMRCSAARPAS